MPFDATLTKENTQRRLIRGAQRTPRVEIMLVQGREAGTGLGPRGIKQEGLFRLSLHCNSTTQSCLCCSQLEISIMKWMVLALVCLQALEAAALVK